MDSIYLHDFALMTLYFYFEMRLTAMGDTHAHIQNIILQ